jgi:hypothetical protein
MTPLGGTKRRHITRRRFHWIRPKGLPNKFNGLLKEALLSAFNGAHPDGLASWVLQEAKANPTAGLALLGRLIPVSTEGTVDATLTVRHVDETAD